MNRQKGIAYCGLACCLCGHNSCPGCREDGCKEREWCKNLKCCREKGLSGCWECGEFPCNEKSMLDQKRIRAFARFAKEYGAENLLDCLERNERSGMVYHNPGELKGDYDKPDTEEKIMELLLFGKEHEA